MSCEEYLETCDESSGKTSARKPDASRGRNRTPRSKSGTVLMVIGTGLTEQLRTLHRQSRHEEVIAGLEGKLTEDNPELHLVLGLAYFMSSDQQRGLEMMQRALETEPANSAWRSDAALAKMVTGDIETAATWLEEVIVNDTPAAVDFGRLAAVRLSQGLQDSAVEAYREAIHREPGREHWHHNLASVYLRMGKLEQALEHYDAALSIAPDFDRSVTDRRTLLGALDKSEELVEELEAQLASDEDNIGYRVQLAWALDQDNRLSEAIRCLGHSVKPVPEILDTEDADPDHVKGEVEADADAGQETPSKFVAEQITLRLVQAELFHKHSRHGPALRKWDEVDELTKEENPGIVCARSNALVELGRYEEAEALLDEAQVTDPENNPLNIARSHLLVERGDYEAAEELLQSLVEVYPGNASLLTNLGQSQLWVGKLDEAAECFERASEINPMALAQIVRTGKMPRNPQALEKMSSIADNRLMPKAARSSMCFALADLYDREQEFDKAARFMTTANELVNSELNYSADQFSRNIDNIIRVFSEGYLENLPAIRGSDRVPVFVVGMPRSGTTLTEQILSSHPQVFGAGELELLPVLTRLMPRVLKAGSPFPGCMRAMTGELREEAGRYYLYGLQQHDEASHYVVDKMPHNFVNLGLIASVLPGARIVHVSRDPRDTALSNYLQNFKAREGGLGYAFQLGNLARQLNDYARIMGHWRQVLPAPIFELNYEELVEDQEVVTRKLLQFIGVDWHDDVRDFHKTERSIRTASVSQVRQPIYKTSRQRWRNYEEMLQPLISLLDQELPGQ